jgi:8-oxo-dGTP diphosphatase
VIIAVADLLTRLTAEAIDAGIIQLVVGAVVRDQGRILLLRRPADDFMGAISEPALRQGRPG